MEGNNNLFSKKSEFLTAISLHIVIRETILGYVFWTLFQALVPMIWFYPLNELEITGYEAVAGVYLTPFILSVGPVRRMFQTRWILGICRLSMVACIASFQARTTLLRLTILAVGCGFSMLVFTCTLWSGNARERNISCWGLLLGLLVFVSSRIWFVSFIPAYMTYTSNSAVVAIGALATFDKILSGDDATHVTANRGAPPQSATAQCGLILGLGLGSLMYLTQTVFGEVSLVSRWVVSGYPSNGPSPNPWGALILMGLAVGLVLSHSRCLVTHVGWFIVGPGSLAALLYLPTWMGFTGGVILSIWTTSLWPEMLDRVTTCPPGRVVVTALIIYIAEMLFSVWTVAYNFVPGGEYTREHTDYLFVFLALTIGLAMLTGKRQHKSRTAFVLESETRTKPSFLYLSVLVLIVLSGLAGFVYRWQPQSYNHPAKEFPKADFKAAIFTYHFGYDNKGWPSMERTAKLFERMDADVITLLESDASKPFLGNNDLGMWLGERLNMHVDFGPSTRDHTWGNLILSKYPFVKSTHHLLPSPTGELAPAVTATVNMTGHLVDFVVTHMGNDRDMLDRKLQAEVLSSELKNAMNPVVFLGYVTSSPGSRDYRQLTQVGDVRDIDVTDKDRWCEYIMYRGLIRLGYARISHGGLSDTEIQMGNFRFPENPDNFSDHDKYETDPVKVDPDVRFSEYFGPYKSGHNYGRGHNFHMDTPKYFLPEESPKTDST